MFCTASRDERFRRACFCCVTRHVPTCKFDSEQHPTIQNTSPMLVSFRRTGQKMTGTCIYLISNSCRPPTYLRPAANTGALGGRASCI